MRANRRRLAAVGGLVAVLGMAGVAGVGLGGLPAVADPSTFFGAAGADGARVTYSIVGFLIVDDLVDTSTVSAQASVSDLDSDGLAAAANPGSTVRSGPGLVEGSSPVAIPTLPPYPLVAESSTSSPSASVSQGPVSLTANSTAQSSDATASAAGESTNGDTFGSSTSDAKATQDPTTGAVQSTADSDTQPTTFAGVLTIGHTHASASAKGAGDGGPATTSSSFEADGVTVAGQAVKVTPGGLELPGTNVPLPATDPIAAALHAANLTVNYVAPVKTAQGITSAGLVVQQSEPVPNSPNPGILTITFGRADASAVGGGANVALGSNSGGSGSAVPASTGNGSGGFTPAGSTSSSGTAPATAQPAVTGSVAAPASLATIPSTPSSGSTGSSVSPSPSTPRIRAARVAAPQTSSASFYGLLVLGAAAVLLSQKGLRMFAVKLAWT